MVVLVLILIWLAALVPFALRKLSERQVVTSVDQFRHLTGRLSTVQPSATPERDGASLARESRQRRAQARLRQQRRKRALAVLAGTFLFTLTFGAIPALRALWDLMIVDLICGAAYVGLLVYFAKGEGTYSRPAMTLPRAADLPAEAQARPVLAVVGGSPAAFPPAPQRPAFRIVEVQS